MRCYVHTCKNLKISIAMQKPEICIPLIPASVNAPKNVLQTRHACLQWNHAEKVVLGQYRYEFSLIIIVGNHSRVMSTRYSWLKQTSLFHRELEIVYDPDSLLLDLIYPEMGGPTLTKNMQLVSNLISCLYFFSVAYLYGLSYKITLLELLVLSCKYQKLYF